MRGCYTWHLRPPFNDEFDHSHGGKASLKLNLSQHYMNSVADTQGSDS